MIPASGRPIGWVPTREELELLDIEDCEDIHELLSTPSSFWREEVEEMRAYFSTQVRLRLYIYIHCCTQNQFCRWGTACPRRCGASWASLRGG